MKVNKIEILARNVWLSAAKIEIIETEYFTDNSLKTKYKHKNISSRYITNTAV